MVERVILRMYLPIEMGAFARILSTAARHFPDGVLGEMEADGGVAMTADDDPKLTAADRRRIVRERQKARK